MEHKTHIKPRRNAGSDGLPERRRAVRLIRTHEGEGGELMGYGRRWSVGTAFSIFKRLYGEYCLAKTGQFYRGVSVLTRPHGGAPSKASGGRSRFEGRLYIDLFICLHAEGCVRLCFRLCF